ncbi:MAG: hypothetical protein LC795_18335 [Acidobacteria bacterium]|nr:hypothetical protein [Acidobacteriota bacterium]
MSEPTERDGASRWRHDESERDACAIIANVKEGGRPSHGNVKRTLAGRAQFTVAHLMIPHERREEADAIMLGALAVFEDSRLAANWREGVVKVIPKK